MHGNFIFLTFLLLLSFAPQDSAAVRFLSKEPLESQKDCLYECNSDREFWDKLFVQEIKDEQGKNTHEALNKLIEEGCEIPCSQRNEVSRGCEKCTTYKSIADSSEFKSFNSDVFGTNFESIDKACKAKLCEAHSFPASTQRTEFSPIEEVISVEATAVNKTEKCEEYCKPQHAFLLDLSGVRNIPSADSIVGLLVKEGCVKNCLDDSQNDYQTMTNCLRCIKYGKLATSLISEYSIDDLSNIVATCKTTYCDAIHFVAKSERESQENSSLQISSKTEEMKKKSSDSKVHDEGDVEKKAADEIANNPDVPERVIEEIVVKRTHLLKDTLSPAPLQQGEEFEEVSTIRTVIRKRKVSNENQNNKNSAAAEGFKEVPKEERDRKEGQEGSVKPANNSGEAKNDGGKNEKPAEASGGTQSDQKPADTNNEKPAESLNNKPAEKQPENSAEKQPENQTEQPANNTAEATGENPSKASAEGAAERPAESSAERPADGEKPAESASEKPVEASDKKQSEVAPEKPAEGSAEKPAAEKPADSSKEKPTEGEKPADGASEKPAEGSSEKPVEASEKKPTEAAAEMPVEGSSEKPAESTEEKPADKSSEKTIDTSKEKSPEAGDSKKSEGEQNSNPESVSKDGVAPK